MSGRIFLANVGANSSHRFSGPLFRDGTFEFLPIPDDRDLSGPQVVRYRDLRSRNAPGRDLLRYVPRRLWDRPTHNDPEFDTFTYGDNCATSPRAAALKNATRGDYLFFITRLEHRLNGGARGDPGFFLIGFLEIDQVLREVAASPCASELARFHRNAHVRRGLSDGRLWDGFWVFGGSARSRRFHTAAPVTRRLACLALSDADGAPWKWDGGRTDLQVIGSYTRSCRCIIDPELPKHRARYDALWEWVGTYESDILVPDTTGGHTRVESRCVDHKGTDSGRRRIHR